MIDLSTYLCHNPYPGRGVLLGVSPQGRGVLAYFIMGRSVNSRNRVFVAQGDTLLTQAHDPALVTDPSLIIYAPIRVWQQQTIVTNGDQTDTVYQALQEGSSFAQALRSRSFEPDAPNFTPRISGLLSQEESGFSYRLSILKRGQTEQEIRRYFYEYAPPTPGFGHLIHTYAGDGQPLPSFAGEPVCCAIPEQPEQLAAQLWQSLNPQNKVSLCVRYLERDGSWQQQILNKNGGD